MEESEPENYNIWQDEEFLAMLDARREEYLRGEGKIYTWEEIKDGIRELQKKNNARRKP